METFETNLYTHLQQILEYCKRDDVDAVKLLHFIEVEAEKALKTLHEGDE